MSSGSMLLPGVAAGANMVAEIGESAVVATGVTGVVVPTVVAGVDISVVAGLSCVAPAPVHFNYNSNGTC